MARAYDNSRRAQAAAETNERIALATEALLHEGPLPAVTLQAIAERAGVTVQTVLRKMGSREGCIEAAGERIGARIDAQRGASTPGDVAAAIDGLLLHYETDGRLVLNLLSQEASHPFAQAAVREGRAQHRAWVVRCFAPCRPGGLGEADTDALVVATDLYVWKLLRLDLGRSRDATRAAMLNLVHLILEAP
jgi:AcrR family transcriptional regulator